MQEFFEISLKILVGCSCLYTLTYGPISNQLPQCFRPHFQNHVLPFAVGLKQPSLFLVGPIVQMNIAIWLVALSLKVLNMPILWLEFIDMVC